MVDSLVTICVVEPNAKGNYVVLCVLTVGDILRSRFW